MDDFPNLKQLKCDDTGNTTLNASEAGHKSVLF